MGVTLITRWILVQVELVVVLRIDPFPGLINPSDEYLSGGADLRPVRVEMFLLYLLCYPLGDILLSG